MNLSKNLSRRTLLVAVLAGFVLLSAFLFYTTPKSPIQNSSAPLTANTAAVYKQEGASFGLPVRLKVPNIGVDAAVEQVGFTPDGAMDVPKGPADVAWFDPGPHPGDSGSAVIAGHEGWKDGIRAAFDNLYKLQKGDKIYVEDGKGATTTFVVREMRTYSASQDFSDVFRSTDGGAHLNLITCAGVWNKAQKSYADRLVVFTDKEIE
jgi:LPXTG-site transpeptidase (sortase) family protein